MKRVITDQQGNILDQNGNIIGKRNGNIVIPVTPKSVQERLQSVISKQDKITEQKPKNEKYTSFIKEYTKYEVSKNSNFVIKFGLCEKDERIIFVRDEYVEQISQAQHHWVKFRMWTYKQQLLWKDKCMKFNNESRSFLIDVNKLNQMKVRNLILDWSFAEVSDKFKLLHVNKYLSDESYQVFKGFYPTIINNIINMMNEILQENG